MLGRYTVNLFSKNHCTLWSVNGVCIICHNGASGGVSEHLKMQNVGVSLFEMPMLFLKKRYTLVGFL
jgi:hypothetical protein